MSATPTEQAHEPTGRELDLEALCRHVYGEKWNEAEVAYRFTGREFKDAENPYE